MSNDQLPERDPTKTNSQQGLYGKLWIERTDGSSAPGGKHHGCQYFVLDVTHDKHAAVALAAYAGAVAATHPQLAADMRERWSLPAQPAGDAPMPVVATWSERVKHLDRPTDFAERCAAVEEARDLRWALEDAYARIASMRTEWGAEVAALTSRIASLEVEGAKSERRSLTFGDALHRHILAMRAAVVAWHRGEASDGMTWVSNTLSGPGHLPSAEDIALGAQALFDKEVAEHEAFRAANPGPAAPAPRDTAAMLADHMVVVRHVVEACDMPDLRTALSAVEASARKLLGEA